MLSGSIRCIRDAEVSKLSRCTTVSANCFGKAVVSFCIRECRLWSIIGGLAILNKASSGRDPSDAGICLLWSPVLSVSQRRLFWDCLFDSVHTGLVMALPHEGHVSSSFGRSRNTDGFSKACYERRPVDDEPNWGTASAVPSCWWVLPSCVDPLLTFSGSGCTPLASHFIPKNVLESVLIEHFCQS